MTATDSVLFQERAAGAHRIGVATLNTPRKLNALDLDMIQALTAQLLRWRTDPTLAAVVLRGAGERAFCAGGDVRQVVQAGDPAFAERYFPAEYRLDHLIHTYPKPLLVWGDGIVMGGGLGLMAGGGVRVVTPRSLLAMPEITIGLFPDVGASWFLNRMPGGCGLYVGLTGARLTAADALFLGLADYLLPADSFEALLAGMEGMSWSGAGREDLARLRALTRELRSTPEASPVRERLDLINELTDHVRDTDLLEAIVGGGRGDPWLEENAARLAAGSPTSVAVIHEQLRRGRVLSLADCFRMELDMVVQFTRRHDFPEGVRALLIDKDNRPDWRPARLADVTAARVAEHFASPWGSRPSPLADLERDTD